MNAQTFRNKSQTFCGPCNMRCTLFLRSVKSTTASQVFMFSLVLGQKSVFGQNARTLTRSILIADPVNVTTTATWYLMILRTDKTTEGIGYCCALCTLPFLCRCLVVCMNSANIEKSIISKCSILKYGPTSFSLNAGKAKFAITAFYRFVLWLCTLCFASKGTEMQFSIVSLFSG